MTIIDAILLGALQGATEFLPVSSSGHLLVTKNLIGAGDIPVLFDVLLHVATLVAVVFVFRQRIGAILGAIWRVARRSPRPEDRPNLRLVPILVVATVVTAAVGLSLERTGAFESPLTASILFIVTAAFLVATFWSGGARRVEYLGYRDAIVIGIAQGFGVLPGISRSGITIATGLFSGLDRQAAGEFSFLLSIPAIVGALVLTLGDFGELSGQVPFPTIAAGFLSAVVVGFMALKVLLHIVRAGRIYLFALYLVPLGIWGIVQFS